MSLRGVEVFEANEHLLGNFKDGLKDGPSIPSIPLV